MRPARAPPRLALPQVSYASPVLHHVLVSGLAPNQTIYYTVGDPGLGAVSSEYNITVPPAPTTANLPFRIGGRPPLPLPGRVLCPAAPLPAVPRCSGPWLASGPPPDRH